MTPREIGRIIDGIKYPGFHIVFDCNREGELGAPDIMWLQVLCTEGVCNVTGRLLTWMGRRWIIENRDTEGEIVRTALKAVLTAVEHEARERFTYKGETIFDPHKAGVK